MKTKIPRIENQKIQQNRKKLRMELKAIKNKLKNGYC